MDITSIIKAVLTPGEGRSGQQTTDLHPGDRLIGRVLRVENDGKALMDLGGNRALARIGFPVHAGQTLQLQVVENGSLLHLQVEPASAEGKKDIPLPNVDFQKALPSSDRERLVGLARRLIVVPATTPSKSDLPDGVKFALTRIITLFEPVPLESPIQKLSQWIKGIVDDSGTLFEKKLSDAATASNLFPDQGSEKEPSVNHIRTVITRDVKSQLVSLRQFLPSSSEQKLLPEKLDAESVAFLRKSIDRLLGHIESQQDRAVARWADGESQQVFVHTLQLPDQKRPVQLKMYYPKKEASSCGNGRHRIALLLDMDRLGSVRVDLAMQERMLKITIYVEHLRTLDLMQDEVKSVTASLSGIFEHVSADIIISREKIVAFEKEDANKTGGGGIDLSV